MKTGKEFADCALLPKWDKYKYDQLDCQGFVEEVLKDIGVVKSNGTPYNWKGCNSMYRNLFSWRGTVEECKEVFGDIPLGAFVYIWTEKGAETVGYFDDLGNCKHVGIYCGNNVVRDSTRSTKTQRNGVGTRTLDGFNRVTLFAGLDYSETNKYNASVEIKTILISMEENINKLRGLINDLYGD